MPNLLAVEQSYRRYALHEQGHRPKTLKQTIRTLEKLAQFADTNELNEINTWIIRDFLHTQRENKGWSAKTFRIYRQCLKSYFQWAVDENWIAENPVTPIKQPPLPARLPRCLSKDQVITILAHVQNYPWFVELQTSRNEAILAIITYAGLRLSELINLKMTDVDFNSNWIHIVQGKNRKDRNVPLNPELKPILQRYLKAHKRLGIPSIWLLPSVRSASQLTDKNVQTIFKTISKASGIKVTPHMLRHTFGRLCVEAGINLRTIQEYMGHSDIRTTQIYTFVSPIQGQKEISRFSLFHR